MSQAQSPVSDNYIETTNVYSVYAPPVSRLVSKPRLSPSLEAGKTCYVSTTRTTHGMDPKLVKLLVHFHKLRYLQESSASHLSTAIILI